MMRKKWRIRENKREEGKGWLRVNWKKGLSVHELLSRIMIPFIFIFDGDSSVGFRGRVKLKGLDIPCLVRKRKRNLSSPSGSDWNAGIYSCTHHVCSYVISSLLLLLLFCCFVIASFYPFHSIIILFLLIFSHICCWSLLSSLPSSIPFHPFSLCIWCAEVNDDLSHVWRFSSLSLSRLQTILTLLVYSNNSSLPSPRVFCVQGMFNGCNNSLKSGPIKEMRKRKKNTAGKLFLHPLSSLPLTTRDKTE